MVTEWGQDQQYEGDKARPSPTRHLRLAQAALSSIADGVIMVDTEGRMVFINEVGRRLLHWNTDPTLSVEQQATALGMRYLDGRPVPPEEMPLGRAIRGESVEALQLILGQPDGSDLYLTSTASPVLDEHGLVAGAFMLLHDVTEQRRSERQYKTILRTAMDGFSVVDTHGRFLDVNEDFCRRIGYSRDEMLTMGLADIKAAESPEEVAQHLQQIRERGSDRFETRLRRKDGSVVDIEVSVNYLESEDGRYFSFLRDITGRKQAEREREDLLDEAETRRQLLQAIVENAPAGIAVLRAPELIFELINPAYQALAPGKPILGRSFTEVWPELVSDALPILQRVLRTGEPHRAIDIRRYVRRAPEGPMEEVYLTIGINPMRSIDGQSDGLLLSTLETTEQVRARARIEELVEMTQRRAAELQAVLDNMVDAVLVADIDGCITLANTAGLRLFGLSSLDEIDNSLVEFSKQLELRLLDGTPVTYAELPLVRALAGEIVSQDEVIRNVETQQDLYIRASAAPIRDEQGHTSGAVEVSKDVTELTQLDRLKDQFIAVAAHELKTPVTIMKGYAQALLRGDDSIPPARHRVLDAIDRGADRITRIVQDLLDISRLQLSELELRLERIDVAELTEGVIDRLSLTTTRHGVRLVTAEPVVIHGDRDRLEQVLINLLDNAITYSPQGGEIDVAVYVCDREAVVSVRDHGVGIPQVKQSRIFQRFHRAHTGTPYDYGGMGVGLYISNEIIKRHGGRMCFQSKEGEGSTFYFSLPLAGSSAKGREDGY